MLTSTFQISDSKNRFIPSIEDRPISPLVFEKPRASHGAGDSYGDYAKLEEPSSTWGNRFWGLAKAAGGALEAAAGIGVGTATSWSGVGLVAGGGVALHGADTVLAALRQIYTGIDSRTLTSLGIEEITGSETAGEILDAGVGLVGTAGVGMASGFARNERLVEKTIRWTDKLPAGEGYTGTYGSMVLSELGSLADQTQVFLHEKVHSFLSPGIREFFSQGRANLRDFLYGNSDFMRYSEEAIAETAAQVGTRKMTGSSLVEAVKNGIEFPLINEYVDSARLTRETLGVAGKVASTEEQIESATLGNGLSSEELN